MKKTSSHVETPQVNTPDLDCRASDINATDLDFRSSDLNSSVVVGFLVKGFYD